MARQVLKTKDFKSRRIRTYATSCPKPFRIRTSKKEGGGGYPSENGTRKPNVPRGSFSSREGFTCPGTPPTSHAICFFPSQSQQYLPCASVSLGPIHRSSAPRRSSPCLKP